MKKNVVLAVSLILLCVLFSACHDNDVNTENEVIPLSSEEVEQINKDFEPIIVDANGQDSLNPLSHFVNSYYEKSKDIDLFYLLYHFPSECDVLDEKEFHRLKLHENFPFPETTTQNTMHVPIHKISARAVDKALKEYMNITLKDLTYITAKNIIYLEEYDAFYNFTSDFSPGFFTCTSGERQGDIIRLFGSEATLTLQKTDDRYIFISHVKAEQTMN